MGSKIRRWGQVYLGLESLEDRLAPAVYQVLGTVDNIDPVAPSSTAGIDFDAPSLRSAILAANALVGADVIHLPTGTYQLDRTGKLEDAGLTGDLDITESLTIIGADRANTIVQGRLAASFNNDRIFHLITPFLKPITNVAISNVTISNGQASAGTGPATGGQFVLHGQGGGLFVDSGSRLTLNSCTVNNNVARGGAAASVQSVSGGSGEGGGIYAQNSDVILIDTTVALNRAVGAPASVTFFPSTDSFGGDAWGGGICLIEANLTATNSLIAGNEAAGGEARSTSNSTGGDGIGGGVFVNASLPAQFNNTQIYDNIARGGLGSSFVATTPAVHSTGGNAEGGGIFNGFFGTVNLDESVLRNNQAIFGPATNAATTIVGQSFGGGLSTRFGTSNLVDTLVYFNSADTGGGLYNRDKTNITSSTFAGNSTTRDDGGTIWNLDGTVTVTNSTLSGNFAVRDAGGVWQGRTGRTILRNSTLTLNRADADDSNGGDGGGAFVDTQGVIEVRSTIIAGNGDFAGGTAFHPDISGFGTGAYISLGNNLIGDPTGGNGFGGGDLIGVDPLLGPLAANGGPTETHVLLAGSPAIDAGSNPAALAIDQTGAPREFPAGRPDIGAYESQVPSGNQAPTELVLSSDVVSEGSPPDTLIGNFFTIDPDAADTHTYSLVSGGGDADNGAFTIVGDELRSAAEFDFESKYVYSIRVRTTDPGGLIFERFFSIRVLNVNEEPTDVSLSNISVDENIPPDTVIGSFSSSDPDAGDTHSYSLVSGDGDADNAAFAIVGNEMRNALDFDHEAKSSYSIRVRTTDQGGLPFEKVFTISITNVNEQPTDIALSNSSVPENSPLDTVIGSFSSSDPDAGDTHSYSLVSGDGDVDNAAFTIVGDELLAVESFDDEAKSEYSIRVRTTDQGGLPYEKVLTISITNVNEAPSELALSNSSVAENSPADSVIGSFSSSDPDAGDTHSYSLVSGDGDADNASFTIVGNELRSAAGFDFEAKSSYSIRVRTTDQGGLPFEKVFSISVTDVNEAPTNLALSDSSVSENRPLDSVIGSFSSSDPDAGDTHSCSLVSGDGDADNAAFTIVGNELRAAESFNHEAKSEYRIRVRTMDQGGMSFEKVFSISVTDVNEAPTADAGGPYVIPEGASLTLDASASADPEGDALVFTWDVNGDGVYGDAVGESPALSWAQLTGLGISSGMTYQVRVQADDGQGHLDESAATTLTVNNGQTLLTSFAATEGVDQAQRGVRHHPITFMLTASGSSAASTFTYQIDWDGDGTWDEASSPGQRGTYQVDHPYEATGGYTPQARAIEDQGGASAARPAEQSVTIHAAAAIGGKVVAGGTASNDLLAAMPAGGRRVVVTLNGSVLRNPAGGNTFTVASDGRVVLYGGAGHDELIALTSQPAEVHGGAGKDFIIGGSASDVLWGDADDDVILALGGHDVLIGGAGQDVLFGNDGHDLLMGGELRPGLAHNDVEAYDWTVLRGISRAWSTGTADADLLTLADDMDDTEQDALFGGLGRDWFLGNHNGPDADLLDFMMTHQDKKTST